MRVLFLFFISFSIFALDHSKFDYVLKNYTVLEGVQVLVQYEKLKKDSSVLVSYLKELDTIKESEYEKFDRNHKLAFLINLYNAQTIALILKYYPVKSIKKIGGFFSSPWKKKFFKLFGKKIHLNRLEHKIIRPRFKDPRVHFALNCASIGCPSLSQYAFRGDKLDQQLDEATIHFLRNSSKNYMKMNRLFLSKIFDWYEDDFGDLSKFVAKYIKGWKGDFEIEFLKYDWNLNSTEK